MNLGVICCHTGNLISILFKSTGIYSNIIYVTKAIVTSLTDKNSNKGKTKCRSKYWPIRVVKSNSAILPERKIKEKKFPWIQMIRIRKNVLISIKFLIRIHRNILKSVVYWCFKMKNRKIQQQKIFAQRHCYRCTTYL